MLTFTTFPASVRYLLPNMAVDVAVSDAVQAQAVEAFALENGFEVPAPAEARPVYHCIARTHENGDVLWG